MASASPSRPGTRWGEVRREVVALTTIDRFAATLDLDRLDFIKADIEGWEMHLVRGGTAAIRRFQPVLMLEMTAEGLARAGDDLASAFRAMAALCYRPALPDRNGQLQPLDAPMTDDIRWFPATRG